MSVVVEVEQQRLSVGMGEIKFAHHPDCLYSVLGSCIGLAIVHLRLRVGVFAHIVLPESNGRPGPSGKFADTAIPEMLNLLREQDVPRAGLTVKMTGGSQMFNTSGPMQIGQLNAQAVHAALKDAGLAVQAEEIGGTAGRRVNVDCSTGLLTIARVGQPEEVI
jgi:chemotaxis protein CheD